MASTLRSLIIAVIICGFFAACSKPEAIIDLSNESYSLLNSDSSQVEFPDDYSGNISVISFIYTHCPDVCPVITANLKNIQSDLQDTSNVRFIEITFDPERDTPSVLKKYKELYKLNNQFSLLTADTTTIDSLMSRLNIVAEKTQVDSLQQDSSQYFMKHSNTIYLMDETGKIRGEYPASVVPPEHVIEDIQKLR